MPNDEKKGFERLPSESEVVVGDRIRSVDCRLRELDDDEGVGMTSVVSEVAAISSICMALIQRKFAEGRVWIVDNDKGVLYFGLF